MIMCTVTNFALYIYFAIAYQGQLGPCSVEYQMLQQIVAQYEAAKYPTDEYLTEQEIRVRKFNCAINGTQCEDTE